MPIPDKINCQYSDLVPRRRLRPRLVINTPLIYHVRVATSTRTQVPPEGQNSGAVDTTDNTRPDMHCLMLI